MLEGERTDADTTGYSEVEAGKNRRVDCNMKVVMASKILWRRLNGYTLATIWVVVLLEGSVAPINLDLEPLRRLPSEDDCYVEGGEEQMGTQTLHSENSCDGSAVICDLEVRGCRIRVVWKRMDSVVLIGQPEDEFEALESEGFGGKPGWTYSASAG